MIILPSRGRPHLVSRFAEAYMRTGATCQVILRVDLDDPRIEEYRAVRSLNHGQPFTAQE